jgi:environmental stress-induced protein Ves
MLWRNGRGSTLEIAREPAIGEEYAWRLSLADIDRDCDFSAYPGYRRALVLVGGNGLRLRFRGHGNCYLDPARPGTRFDGDWKTHCAVPDGRCTDLSLIVRKGSAARPACIVRAPTVLQVRSARRLALPKGLYGALFVLDGSVAIDASLGARRRIVRPRDTLLLSPGPGRILTLRSLGRRPVKLVLLRWRPGSSRQSNRFC